MFFFFNGFRFYKIIKHSIKQALNSMLKSNAIISMKVLNYLLSSLILALCLRLTHIIYVNESYSLNSEKHYCIFVTRRYFTEYFL